MTVTGPPLILAFFELWMNLFSFFQTPFCFLSLCFLSPSHSLGSGNLVFYFVLKIQFIIIWYFSFVFFFWVVGFFSRENRRGLKMAITSKVPMTSSSGVFSFWVM